MVMPLVNPVNRSELWNTPFVNHRGTLGFWWWFFILVLKTPRPLLPRQLMLLWATKDVRETIVNGRLHQHEVGIKRAPEQDSFKGVMAGWFFDGKEMHHDLILENMLCRIARSPSPEIHINGQSECTISPNKEGYRLQLDNSQITLDTLWKLQTGRQYYNPISERKRFFHGLIEQNTFKINRFKFTGRLTFAGADEKVEGDGYLQRIVLNTPVPPWWWGVLFFEDGSMMKYFLPHASPAIFRHGLQDHPYLGEVAYKPLRRELDFYDAERDEVYSFKKAYVVKCFKPDGLPVFQFKYTRPDGFLKYHLDCYNRTYFAMTTKAFETPLKPTLYYNEFPCQVSGFELKTTHAHITQDRLGNGVGNCEHSWGIML